MFKPLKANEVLELHFRQTIMIENHHTHNTQSYFEVKAGHNGQFLHGQLLGGFLVTMATTALDLSTAAKVFRPGEPRKSVKLRV